MATGDFERPGRGERWFNALFGMLVGLGVGLPHNYLLTVRGRTTGRAYSTPVNVLTREGRQFLVAPRGQTGWVRNARAAGRVTLKRGRSQRDFAVRELGDDDKPEILKHYLDGVKTTVQRYFPVTAGSPAAQFRPIASRYPVFELLPAGTPPR
jgi:deazaflavin-dependent oxidoreductase (nitroreductase family)